MVYTHLTSDVNQRHEELSEHARISGGVYALAIQHQH